MTTAKTILDIALFVVGASVAVYVWGVFLTCIWSVMRRKPAQF